MFAAAVARFLSFVIIAGAVPGSTSSGCLLAIELFVDLAALALIGDVRTLDSCLSFPHR